MTTAANPAAAPPAVSSASGLRRWIAPAAILGIAAIWNAILVQQERPLAATAAPASIKVVDSLQKMTKGRQQDVLEAGRSAQESNALIQFSRIPLESVAGFSAIQLSDPNYPLALHCLAQAIFYEAANEPRDGKLGVAQVVLNRVRHPAYPKTVCSVVYEGWDRPVCQFSFTCDGSLLRPAAGPRWRESQLVAKAALAGETLPSVGSATNYHADYVVPRWAFTLAKVEKIGAHIFYRFPSRWGGARALSANWAGVERIPMIDRARLAGRLEQDVPIETAGDAMKTRDRVAPLITDRHAEQDIGGRLDPASGWRLSIPDPVAASRNFNSAKDRQAAEMNVSEEGATL